MNFLKSYAFTIILFTSLVLGGLTGYLFPQKASHLKPLGDIFLNLIFMTIVPMIFFNISSAIAKLTSHLKLGRILLSMGGVFLLNSLIAAIFMLAVVIVFPPAYGINLPLSTPITATHINLADQIAGIFTVPEFSALLSHKSILALIVFSLLVGLAASGNSKQQRTFSNFLKSGELVFNRVFSFVMYYAPIGFFAYFAVVTSELGLNIIENYARVTCIYYLAASFYFIVFFNIFSYFAGKIAGVKLFWKNIFLPSTTALATCSSAASIPANLLATKAMRIPDEIRETIIPMGMIMHKDGSVLGGMLKIAFLFGIFHLDFTGISVFGLAIGISILVGTVMGAIPSGGMLGELLILNLYGFPPSVLTALAAISLLIDPPATLLNVIGNTVSAMLIARIVDGKRWLSKTNA